MVLWHEIFLPNEVADANRTSRSNGAVGPKALVPRIVREWIGVTDRVLDFGAGKKAIHAVQLRREGYNITAHEFGANCCPGIHDPYAIRQYFYDLVYASNVLNVQSSIRMLRQTLSQMYFTLKPGGIIIANFPKHPRKIVGLTPTDIGILIGEFFGVETQTVRLGRAVAVGRITAEPVFFIRKQRGAGNATDRSFQNNNSVIDR